MKQTKTNARLFWAGYSPKNKNAHHHALRQIRHDLAIDFVAVSTLTLAHPNLKLVDEVAGVHDNLKRGRYPMEIVADLPQLRSADYRSVAVFEGEAMRMMDRLDVPRSAIRDSEVSTFDWRRRQFLAHTRYWLGYFDTRRISHVVFTAIPHEVYDFIAYRCAEIRELETMILHTEKRLTVRATTGITRNARHRPTSMRKDCFFVSRSLSDVGEWTLSSQLNEFSRGTEDQPLRPEQFIEPLPKTTSLGPVGQKDATTGLRTRLGDARSIARQIGSPTRLVRSWRQQTQYHALCQLVHPNVENQRVLTLLLAFQPEESTSPRAGLFVEQELLARTLASALPTSWVLRIREHPDQFGRFTPRRRNFYQTLQTDTGARFCPLSELPSDTLTKSDAVASVGGSMVIEAWLREIPVLLFGETVMKRAPGVDSCASEEDVRSALLRISGQGDSQASLREEFIQFISSHAMLGDLSPSIATRDGDVSIAARNLAWVLRNWILMT